MPVVEHLARLGKVRTISAVPPPDVIFAKVRSIFEVRAPARHSQIDHPPDTRSPFAAVARILHPWFRV
jgi:hypothetical protein